MPNSASTVAAASIVGQSESEPITIPTRGWSLMGISFDKQSCRPARARDDIIKIIAANRHMTNLAPRFHIFAIQMDLDLAVLRHDQSPPRFQVVDDSAEAVHHHRPGSVWRRAAQRHPEYCTQMVFELARHGAIDAPVTGVVRTHREFVHDEAAIGS